MRKLFLAIVITCVFLPISTNALSLGTKIVGNEKIKVGSNIIYTIILDHPLNEYSAEISYDRDTLNLVSVEEININTTGKEFVVEKANPIILNITSQEPANIVYTLTFNVKNYVNVDSTEISIKTTEAKYQNEKLTSTETFIKPSIVEEDKLFEDVKEQDNNYFSKILSNIKKVFNDYGSFITMGSLALNLILIIALVSSLIRKKVDYDF